MGGLIEQVNIETAELEQLFQVGVDAQTAAKKLVRLSSLLASLNGEVSQAQFDFNKKKRDILIEAKTVARANLIAQAEPEYLHFITLLNTRESLLELIRAVKHYLKTAIEEYREATLGGSYD